ncbi:hypothetical protein [Okeania sp. SIO2B3]|nr:hypothetical protein [Okeania sp. SIO2B3]
MQGKNLTDFLVLHKMFFFDSSQLSGAIAYLYIAESMVFLVE